jgi:predicted transcriptional regulator
MLMARMVDVDVTKRRGSHQPFAISHNRSAGFFTRRDKEAVVARSSWFDEQAEHPVIQEQLQKLESFTSALADGVISKNELDGQEQRLMAAMKTLEPELGDDLHQKVTKVLIELTGYNVMRLLHELQVGRARAAFGDA